MDATPIKDVLADESHPAYTATTEMLAKLKTGAISLCGCMGPMYGEPHCICKMQRLGLPLNEEARAIEHARAEEQLEKLFGPGGAFYNPSEEDETE